MEAPAAPQQLPPDDVDPFGVSVVEVGQATALRFLDSCASILCMSGVLDDPDLFRTSVPATQLDDAEDRTVAAGGALTLERNEQPEVTEWTYHAAVARP